jgi:hypothetical protein
MMQVTVRYGMDQQTVSLPMGTRFGDLRNNSELRMNLGYGDNVKFLVNGVEMPPDANVVNGALITVETAANTKAA